MINKKGDTRLVKIDGFELREEFHYWPRGLTWAGVESDGRVRVGVTDLAQNMAREICFIDIEPTGRTIDQGEPVATLEATKWVGPVESPISGIIEEINDSLKENPILINNDPYGEGWVALLRPTNPEELETLVHGEMTIRWYKREIATRVK